MAPMTYQPSAAEPSSQQQPYSSPQAPVDVYKSPTNGDASHARGGHGIFGEPMVGGVN